MARQVKQRIRDIFGKDPAKLAEMIALRASGASLAALGREYGCLHQTIKYNLERFAPSLVAITHPGGRRRVVKQEVEELPPPPRPPHPSDKYAHLIEEEFVRVNPGRSYAEYRRIGERKRAAERALRMPQLKEEHRARVKARGSLLKKVDRARLFNPKSFTSTRSWMPQN